MIEPTVVLRWGGACFLHMKVLIEMSPEQYELFVAECDIISPEYSILKNSIVSRNGDSGYDGGAIRILCDKEEATQLLQTAKRLFPDATAPIATAIDQASGL